MSVFFSLNCLILFLPDVLIYSSHFTTGTLHVGDEIKEINGIGVSMCSAERLQQILV